MFGIFDKIEEFFKELLLGGIQANLESMFLDINDKVGAVATDVGKTPMGWNGDVFAFIKSINDSVIIPIAGLIITEQSFVSSLSTWLYRKITYTIIQIPLNFSSTS